MIKIGACLAGTVVCLVVMTTASAFAIARAHAHTPHVGITLAMYRCLVPVVYEDASVENDAEQARRCMRRKGIYRQFLSTYGGG